MIELQRKKENKWILQKNVSSADLLKILHKYLSRNEGSYQKESMNNFLVKMKSEKLYKGRSKDGNVSTLGVRLSEACFYMFGYKINNVYIPSMTSQIINGATKNHNRVDFSILYLINLFSIQFPHPFSKTTGDYNIYAGRLIITLLTEKRLKCKLYVDEIIWFLPFIKTINKYDYSNLVSSILEYRSFKYEDKLKLFYSVDNADAVFSNCMHEFKYYFLKIFKELEVINFKSDKLHNDNKCFRFRHGKTNTFRTDKEKIDDANNCYIELNSTLIKYADLLVDKYKCWEMPLTLRNFGSLQEWIEELYVYKMSDYYYLVESLNNELKMIPDKILDMIHQSEYGTDDGKSFEKSLKPVFEMFRDVENVNIISGAGHTDLLCKVYNNYEEKSDLYKVNVDAKKTYKHLSSLNPVRLRKHIEECGSKYCIVVSPRFAKGAITDINNFNIVTIEAKTLGNYCMRECLNSSDGKAEYYSLNKIISNKLGQDITKDVNDLITAKYGIY